MTDMGLASWLGLVQGTPNQPEPVVSTPTSAAPPADAQAGASATADSARVLEPRSSIRIAAADALAAAVERGVGPAGASRAEPKGFHLPPSSPASFNVDTVPSEHVQQLRVSTVANVKSEYRERMVGQITANATYICYGLRPGHIRAISKDTTNKALLKGHTEPLTDMQFSTGSNILASCDESGAVHVRVVAEGPDQKLQEEVLVRKQFGANEQASRRLAWHPQLDTLLAVSGTDRISFVNVPPTEGVASFPEFAEPVTPAGPHTTGLITSLAFSPRGDLLAASDSLGNVHVWQLPPDFCTRPKFDALKPEADLVISANTPGPTLCVDFLAAPNLQHDVLVTGDAANRCIKLWSLKRSTTSTPVGEDGASSSAASAATSPLTARCTYVLQLTSNAGPDALFNHLVVQRNLSVVVLADTKKQQVYVLHVHQDASSGDAAFDYLSCWSVAQPILSLSCSSEPEGQQDVNGQEVFRLYTIQTEMVQEYTLYPTACFPAADLDEEHTRQQQLHAELHTASPPIQPIIPPTVHMPQLDSLHGLSPKPTPPTPTHAAAPEPPQAAPPLVQPAEPVPAIAEPGLAAAAAEVAMPEVPVPLVPEPVLPAPVAVAPVMARQEVEAAPATPPGHVPLTFAQQPLAPYPFPLLDADAPAAQPGTPDLGSAPSSPHRGGQQGRSSPLVDALAGLPAVSTPSEAATAEQLPAYLLQEGSGESRGAGPSGVAARQAPGSVLLPPPPPMLPPAMLQAANRPSSRSGSAAGATMLDHLAPLPPQPAQPAPAALHEARPAATRTDMTRSHGSANSLDSDATSPVQAAAAAAGTAAGGPSTSAQQQQAAQDTGVRPTQAAAGTAATAVEAAANGSTPSAQPTTPRSGQGAAATVLHEESGLAGDSDTGIKKKSKRTRGAREGPSMPTPSPPVPSPMLLKRGSLTAGLGSSGASTGAALQEGGGSSGAGREVDTAATAAFAAMAGPSALDTSAANYPPGLNQVLAQMQAHHRESVRQLKAEFKAELKASQKAAELVLRQLLEAHAGARDAKREREEVVRGCTAAVTQVARELNSKMDKLQQTIPAQVAGVLSPMLKAALTEALPPATQQAIDKAVDKAVKSALPRCVNDALRESFATTVVPSFERATQAMFGQMSGALSTALAAQVAAASEAAASVKAASTELGQMSNSLKSEVGALAAVSGQLSAAATAGPVAVTAGSQPAAAAAKAARPTPTDPIAIMRVHIAGRRYEEAFSTALSSPDKAHLQWLLQQVEPVQVLALNPCPLSQGVLLSLLSHLSVDLDVDTELRLHWLMEACKALDASDAQCKSHGRLVLEPLKRAVTLLAHAQSGEVGRVAKTCVHIINSVIHMLSEGK